MGRYAIIALLILLLAAAMPVSAQEEIAASNYTIDFYIEYGKILVDTNIYFDEPVTGTVEFRLPLDARAITMRVDGGKVNPSLEGNLLSFEVEGNKGLQYQYITDSFIEGNSFIANVNLPISADLLMIKVSLPEKAVLANAIGEGDITTPSVFPKPTRLETDGRVIDILWIAEDVAAEDELPLMVRFDFPPRAMMIGLAAASGVFLVLLALYFIMRKPKRRPPKVIVLRPDKKERHAPGIENHLKEDEEQLVTILKDRDGECEQGTLRVITGFSKAKLSGLLKELEDRKLVHKEKRGKKNLVFLRR